MTAQPEWWPTTLEEWIGLLELMIDPREVVRLEDSARQIVRHPEWFGPRLYFQNLLDGSSTSEIEMQAFIAIRDDERRRPLRVVEK